MIWGIHAVQTRNTKCNNKKPWELNITKKKDIEGKQQKQFKAKKTCEAPKSPKTLAHYNKHAQIILRKVW